VRALAVSNPALTLASREELQEVVVHGLSKVSARSTFTLKSARSTFTLNRCPEYIYIALTIRQHNKNSPYPTKMIKEFGLIKHHQEHADTRGMKNKMKTNK